MVKAFQSLSRASQKNVGSHKNVRMIIKSLAGEQGKDGKSFPITEQGQSKECPRMTNVSNHAINIAT